MSLHGKIGDCDVRAHVEHETLCVVSLPFNAHITRGATDSMLPLPVGSDQDHKSWLFSTLRRTLLRMDISYNNIPNKVTDYTSVGYVGVITSQSSRL